MHRGQERPTRPLVPWGTRCYLHACPGLQGTRNLAKILWDPQTWNFIMEKTLLRLPLPESRMACYNGITPQGPLTKAEISLVKNYFWEYVSAVRVSCCRWLMVTTSCVESNSHTAPFIISKTSSFKVDSKVTAITLQYERSYEPKPLHSHRDALCVEEIASTRRTVSCFCRSLGNSST